MLEYWIIFIIILGSFLFKTISGEKLVEDIGFFIVLVLGIAIGALRSNLVGTDTPGYVRDMPITVSQDISTIIEHERDPFFWILIKFLFLFSDSYTLYFTVLAVSFWGFSAFVIKKYSDEILLALLVFVSFRFSDFYMNAMRQGFSIAIVFYSIKFIFEKKPISFVAVIIVASLFHQSAIFFILAYLLQYFNFLKFRWIIPVLFVFVLVFRHFLYHSLFVSLISENKQYAGYALVETEHGILYLALYAFTFVMCYFFYNKLVPNPKFNLLFNIVYIGLLLQVICLVNVGFSRIAVYYTQYFVLIVPMVYKQMVNEYGETKSFAFWFFFMLGLYIVGGPAPGVVPYRFYWE